MDELYLVAYSHYNPCGMLSPPASRESKSISFPTIEDCGKTPTALLKGLVDKIEKQTGDKSVQVLAITPLHKIVDYATENQTYSVGVVPSPH
jgi:hypothetical protein